jgi:NAD(P)-dependent dehydrogenase (short-subunit alcohol dehydrogenase family)
MPVDRRDSTAALTGGATYPSLRGKSVFITGGGSGIGGCLTEAFARQGALVAFVDIAESASQTLVERIESEGHARPWYRNVDVTQIPALQSAIQDAAKAVGDFHVLVNNVASDDRHDFMDVTPEYYDKRIAVNQRPAYFAIQAVVPGMKKMGGGSIINFGSNSYGAKGRNMSAYTTAKSSVIGLTRGLAAELGEHRIRINVITPGWIMTERQITKWLTPEGEEEIRRNQVLPDKVRPEDVTPMALFLASDDSRACSAQEYIVDAGWL